MNHSAFFLIADLRPASLQIITELVKDRPPKVYCYYDFSARNYHSHIDFDAKDVEDGGWFSDADGDPLKLVWYHSYDRRVGFGRKSGFVYLMLHCTLGASLR